MVEIVQPDIVGAYARGLQTRHAMQQIQDEDRERAAKEQLRALFARPGFDATKPEGMQEVMSLDPKMGMDLRKQQAELAHLDAQSLKQKWDAADKKTKLTAEAAQTAWTQYQNLPEQVRDLPETKRRLMEDSLQIYGLDIPQWDDIERSWGAMTGLAQHGAWIKSLEAGLTKQAELPYEQQRDAYKAGLDYANSAGLKGLDYENNVKLKGVLSADAERAAQAQEVAARRATVPPAGVVEGYINNHNAISKIDQALELLNQHPDGVGLDQHWTPNWAATRTDPQGVALRALIADIGGAKIHDRSGAAVSASESPRLIPYIPQITDPPATIRDKLANFRKEYDLLNKGFEAAYGPETGYALPKLGQQQPAQPSPLNSKFQIGQVIPTRKGVNVRVTGFLPDGRPTVEPVQ